MVVCTCQLFLCSSKFVDGTRLNRSKMVCDTVKVIRHAELVAINLIFLWTCSIELSSVFMVSSIVQRRIKFITTISACLITFTTLAICFWHVE